MRYRIITAPAKNEGGVKKISMVNGKEALVSDEWYPILSEYRWYQYPNGYIYRRDGGRAIMMHREITAATKRQIVLHQDGNRLNCTLENLVVQNKSTAVSRRMQQAGQKKGSSPYRGVSWNRAKKQWQAVIRHEGKLYHLGFYDPTPEGEIEAAHAYDAAALRFRGENARPNFERKPKRRVKGEEMEQPTAEVQPTPVVEKPPVEKTPEARPAKPPVQKQEPTGLEDLYEKPLTELTPEEIEKMKARFLGERYRRSSGGSSRRVA